MLPGFRGYQITATMSALGQKRTLSDISAMSALPPKADIGTLQRDVRFVPKADSCTAAIGGRNASAYAASTCRSTTTGSVNANVEP